MTKQEINCEEQKNEEEEHNMEQIEKKERRGRKKKQKDVEVVKIKKKRGRKASSQFYSSLIRKKLPNLLDNTEEVKVEEEKNTIIHIDITEEEEESSWKEYTESSWKEYTETKEHIENKTTSNEDKNFYQKNIYVLKNFETDDNWPEKTNINCWWCCHNFDNIPIGLPIKLYNNFYYLKGCFCSFNCSLAYLNDNKYKYKYDYIHSNLKSLRAKLTDKILNDELLPAPPRECLSIFGGELSIDNFRTFNKNNDRIFLRVNYPMKIITEQIENLSFTKPVVNKIYTQELKQELSKDLITQAQIRISKNKELKTSANTLDQFLMNF